MAKTIYFQIVYLKKYTETAKSIFVKSIKYVYLCKYIFYQYIYIYIDNFDNFNLF